MYNTIKAAVVIISVVSFLALTAYGQDSKWTGFVEAQGTTASSGEVKPQLNISVERKLTKKTGLFGWVLVADKYSEAYGGGAFSPNGNVTVALGAGVETSGGKTRFRIGGSVFAKYKRFGSFTALEGAGSGFWFKSTNNVKVAKNLKVGVVIQRFKGIAPNVEYDIPQAKLKVWGRVFFNGSRDPVVQFGVRYNFGF